MEEGFLNHCYEKCLYIDLLISKIKEGTKKSNFYLCKNLKKNYLLLLKFLRYSLICVHKNCSV